MALCQFNSFLKMIFNALKEVHLKYISTAYLSSGSQNIFSCTLKIPACALQVFVNVRR